MDPVIIKCYVCNIKTDDWRSNLIGLKSQHSDTLVTDFIKRFLGDFKSMRSINDEENCICSECLNKIEEYDWTCLLAKRYEKEMYEVLVQTEQVCMSNYTQIAMLNSQNESDLNELSEDQSFNNELLVEAFTPITQLNFEAAIDEQVKKSAHFLTKEEKLDEQPMDEMFNEDNVDEAIPENDSDPEYHEQVDSISSYDEEEDDNDDEDDVEDEDEDDHEFVPISGRSKRKTRSTESGEETTDKQRTSKRRGRPRVRPVLDSSQKRKPGRPKMKESPARKKREKKSYECKECDIIFVKQVEFVSHRKWHREQAIPKYRCSICFYISDGQETFDAHAKKHETAEPLQCVFCNIKVSCKGTLTKHTKIHADVQNYQCHLCGKQFVRSMSLQIHMKYHLNIRTKQCPHCPMTFVESKNLNRHLKTHTQIKPYSCSICGRRFAHSYNVRPHEKTHTDPNVYRKFKCNFCKSAFDSKAKLSQHLQKAHSMVTPHLENTNNLNESGPLSHPHWTSKQEGDTTNEPNTEEPPEFVSYEINNTSNETVSKAQEH